MKKLYRQKFYIFSHVTIYENIKWENVILLNKICIEDSASFYKTYRFMISD